MRPSFRILFPLAAALLTVFAVLMTLFFKLEQTRAFLAERLPDSPAALPFATNHPTSVSTAPYAQDAALLALRRGDVYVVRGEWKEAEAAYTAAADGGGGLPALRKLAQAKLQLRDIHGARATLDRLRREGAKHEDVLLLESIILLRTGEFAKAKMLLEESDESPQKHYGLALLSIVSKNHETAKAELAAVNGGWEPTLRVYARALLQAYEEYAIFPESPEHHLLVLLGRALAENQECELALPLLSQVTTAIRDYRDAWLVQGYCELISNRSAEALASLEQAYQLDPEKPETQYFLARAYRAKEDHPNALTFLQYALRNGFEPASEVRRLLAEEALLTGNATLAIEQYDALSRETDAALETFTAYVTAAITAKRTQEAVVKAQEAATKWPQDAEALALLGWAQKENGQKEEAKTTLERALAMNPDSAMAREKLEEL